MTAISMLFQEGEDAVLMDGGSVVVRPLGPPDKPQVSDFFAHLSGSSSKNRFFGATRGVSDADLSRMTERLPPSLALAAIAREDGLEHIIAIAEIVATAAPTPATGDGTPRRAEFAVAVADEHQGRGLGTLLLERLVTAAREAGIEHIEADVLAENAKMLEVFAKSGYELTEAQDSGVVHVVFPTRETESLVAANLERERIAARESVRVFFEPSSVAVVGASRHEKTIGRALTENLLRAGFKGPIYPINPSAKEIAGIPCFPSLHAIGKPVDLVVIAVPAPHVEGAVMEAAEAHARGIVIISSGFAESSPEGRAAEVRIRRLVRSHGMRLIGPNCMGVLNTKTSLDATFAPHIPPAGNVSMLSQSGALGIAMLDYAEKLNIGISGFASLGNKADVSSNDLIAYWGDDPNTRVIVLYLESFGNSRKFARLAPEIARKKPIVAVKSGRSAAGTRAASSHSAALASMDVGVDALFAQAGVIRTNTLEELFDLIALLSTQPAPKGPRVGVVTNAGGPGILLADACEANGLVLPTLAEETLAALRRVLPLQAGLSNPIDMIASANAEQYEQAIRLVGRDPNVDALVVIYIPPLVTSPEEIAGAIARSAGDVPGDKPILSVFLSSKGAPPLLSGGARGKIPSYSFPENAAIALAASLRHARFCERPRGSIRTIASPESHEIRRIVDRALRGPEASRGWLEAEDLNRVLALAGIESAGMAHVVADPEAAAEASQRLGGYPVVLKAAAEGLLHKTEAGGVVLGLDSADSVRNAAARMKEKLETAGYRLDGFIVQRQIDGGLEALVGVTTDPSLGPILVAGIGGVSVELLRDVSFRIPPVSDLDAREMLESLKAKKLFDGFRGAEPADRAALVEVVTRVSALVEIVPELVELDLNPVKVLPPGRGAIVVDGRLRVAAPAASANPPR